ncbi:DNA-formamidopyrimidine glycosylase [Hyphomicrobium methylovorum]|uniref:bifunctional DNA-formamidopyrimidine glycosylase/DNA-(apurinic or apyrimidinic site) lyase n=1 Tax=Hyphomicrobium methylovorum TaxID=84 RepID=UPI0015E67747|nr:bifunctional DNA-formamidopyrimidine glycosylase/DNA-(apurinic or apyrimidinic site) lyase [Hyphomicrobium methylovorum]MBA2126437.1 DNA-formamidopyrimidine glycosylase [Hyphomicrobium methylovorum]
MPELPEVETVRRGLAPVLVGNRIKKVETRRADLRFPFPDHFADRLRGQEITALERRAKYLIAQLASGEDLVMHLGMTGRFTVAQDGLRTTPGEYAHPAGADGTHDHVVFHLSDGSRVIYNDARRFGFMVMVAHDERDMHPFLRGLGVEPLSVALSPDYLAARARTKKVNLKSFLMDQRVVAGLGNIYVAEALYQAHLAPDRAARTLADRSGKANDKADRLTVAIKDVLGRAIEARGSTLRDYRDPSGGSGGFQAAFRVYNREGEACRTPGCSGTIRRTVSGGRANFHCPRCQR